MNGAMATTATTATNTTATTTTTTTAAAATINTTTTVLLLLLQYRSSPVVQCIASNTTEIGVVSLNPGASTGLFSRKAPIIAESA